MIKAPCVMCGDDFEARGICIITCSETCRAERKKARDQKRREVNPERRERRRASEAAGGEAMMQGEGLIWRRCVDFPRYEVSFCGQVRRTVTVRGRPPIVLKPYLDGGYLTVRMSREGKKAVRAYVHRLVGKAFHGLTDDTEIDHRQHDTINNIDIRVATRVQNARNARSHTNSSSQFKGVSWDAGKRKWYACISLGGRSKNLGRYNTEIEAAHAYDKAAREAWGEFAYLNLGCGIEVQPNEAVQ